MLIVRLKAYFNIVHRTTRLWVRYYLIEITFKISIDGETLSGERGKYIAVDMGMRPGGGGGGGS